jgi:SAM-dependent methyltransferase
LISNLPNNPQAKDRGSQRWFQQQWEDSLTATRFLYPKTTPTTQWEIFEREKATRIDAILTSRGLFSGRTLEYGCGTAGMSVYLANQGFQATATDISVDALKLADLSFRANGQRREDSFGTSAANVFHLPFPDGTFDISMSHGLLEHFNKHLLPSVLQEATRILKPDGLFLADISHGRFSVRKVARWLNFPLSLGYYLLRVDTSKLRALLANYFAGFYENRLGTREWKRALEDAGLVNVEVQVHRPFPPFTLTPALDKKYVALMEKLLPFWNRFDESQSWVARHWGWLYLAYGIKP